MDQSKNSWFQSFSFTNFLKFSIFDTVYAKTGSGESPPKKVCQAPCARPSGPPCPDRAAGGDAPDPKPPQVSDGKSSAGDRGKTGAGVTGSRNTCGGPPTKMGDLLPPGAVNPGLLRNIHNATRYRLPQCFEGGNISVKQSSQNNWVLGHSLSFSSVSPGGYKLLLSYFDKQKETPIPYFIMEAAPGGQMSCEFRVGPTRTSRATLVAQIADGEFYSFESIFDAYFSTFTASVIAVNKEFIALHYLQVRNVFF